MKDISLLLKADQGPYRVGDEIKFKIIFTNIGKNVIRINKSSIYEIEFIKAFDSDREPIERFRKIDLYSVPNSLDVFPEVKPGETTELELTAVLRKDNLSSPLRKGDVEQEKGWFLDFKNSAIRLSGPGNYKFRAFYRSDIYKKRDDPFDWPNNHSDYSYLFVEGFWAEYAKKKFNVDNVWTGEVQSAAVDIITTD